MLAYAIRHMPTGKFMPQRMSPNSGRGFSFWDPTSEAGLTPERPSPNGCSAIPRLFDTPKQAKLSLAAWLAGEFVTAVDYDMYGGCEGSYTDTQTPKVPRKREEMEIVKIGIFKVKS